MVHAPVFPCWSRVRSFAHHVEPSNVTSEPRSYSSAPLIDAHVLDAAGSRFGSLSVALVPTPHRASHGCTSSKTEQRHHPQAK